MIELIDVSENNYCKKNVNFIKTNKSFQTFQIVIGRYKFYKTVFVMTTKNIVEQFIQ